MLIEKILQTSIDLFEPEEIYNPNIENVIINKLTQRYVGYCYQSIYVKSINKILKRSAIKYTTTRLDNGANINVEFEVTGHTVTKDEIIHGCVVIEIKPHGIKLKNDFATIGLMDHASKFAQVLKLGQIIPVIVDEARYTPGLDSVSVRGYPFYPKITPNVYFYIKSPIDGEEEKILSHLLVEVEKQEKILNDLKEKSPKPYEIFFKLLYPFSKQQNFAQGSAATKLKLESVELTPKLIHDTEKALIVLPVEQHPSIKKIFISKITEVQIDKLREELNLQYVVKSDGFQAYSKCLLRYYRYLLALNGFLETYPTKEKFEQNMEYWRLCMQALI